MQIKTIFSGFGGQGVLSMGQAIAKAAMMEGKHVTYMPSYGTEVRGGTANCTVTVSDEEIASPIASEPEFVVALNQPSFVRFQSLLVSGGFILYNSSLIQPDSIRSDIEAMGVPVMEMASKLGNAKVANMILLGAFIKVSNLISLDNLLKNLPDILGAGKAKLLKVNEEAIKCGYNYLKE
ncbi:MAG: 2-oxoacid:acceptor oxidoreductase family protein [Desulfobacterales bacterium]|jgi:2-oxoglutarate ferredoxin oxidoreductase subunit gamma|nr:2-oxoacid:acceptor oxidoreductase family protein [Desulfobacterales bacterium]